MSLTRAKGGEGVGDRELRVAEAEDLRRSSAGATRGSALAGLLDHGAALEHAPEVRRRDVVPERRDVDLAKLREREGRRCEREPGVRVRELPAEPLAAREHDLAVVEGGRRQLVDRVPLRVGGDARVEPELDEPEVGGRELPAARVASGIAVRAELLEVRDLADVDL